MRSLAPLEAVQAWLDGDFGIGDEAALIEAIRKDPRVQLSDGQLTEAMCDALNEELNADESLEHLAGPRGKQSQGLG